MSIKKVCGLLGYTKQAYYKRKNQLQQNRYREDLVVDLVRKKRKLWKRGSGRNLHKSLQEEFRDHNMKIGRDKFYDILRANGLLQLRKRKKVKTTYSYHHFHKYPNLIKGIEPLGPNQIIVSDITYIWLKNTENYCYLFLTTDMYSRKILGYCISGNLKASSALKTIKMAIRTIDASSNCIHHSDRGIQYCCNAYTEHLKRNSIKISMTENGDPLENPIAERINRTIKEEFTTDKTLSFNNLEEAEKEISKIIRFYNEERPHRSIEMLTPNRAYRLEGKLKRKWKTYYKKNDTSLMELL